MRAGKLKFDREVDEDTEDAVPVDAGGMEVDDPDNNAGDIDRYVLLDDVFTKDDYEVIDELEDKRVDAADALKDAYDARVDASDDVEENLKSAEAYLDQLVELREYEQGVANAAAEDADEDDLDENGFTEDQVAANEALETAEGQRDAHDDLQNRSAVVQNLVEALLEPEGEIGDDDGQALVDAIDATYQTAEGAADTANEAMEAVAGLSGEDGTVTANSAAIDTNTTAIDANANDIEGLLTVTEDHDMKLMAKKAYIDAIGAEMGFDPATGLGTGEGGMSRIDANEAGVAANSTAIAAETTDRMAADTALGARIDTNVTNIATNATAITMEETARMEADTMLGSRIDTNATGIMTNAGGIEMNLGSIGANASAISSNADGIAANMSSIGSNASAISDNRNMIGELSDDLSVVRAGVAASMALAGMPAINGRGISIGVGSFDGESAFAVGFQIQGEMASFKVGVTSGGGATGASAGVGFQF